VPANFSRVKPLYAAMRGPICEIKEINNANDVIEANKGLLAEIINNQKLLAQNLTHEIHRKDEILDEGLENIHKISVDKH
jgi:hypothetical protein